MDIRQSLEGIFSDNMLFAFISGSEALGQAGPTSDIDLLVCLKHPSHEQIVKFHRFYRELHEVLGRTPDYAYPGEVITLNTLERKLNFVAHATPRRKLYNLNLYDGLVWAGMLSQPKLEFGKRMEYGHLKERAKSIIRRWNLELFGMAYTEDPSSLKGSVVYKSPGYIRDRSESLKRHIKMNKSHIYDLLTRFESRATAEKEMHDVIDMLENINIEIPHLMTAHVDYVSAFLPINLPLYSMMLFGYVPSLMSERTFIRPPVKSTEIIAELYGMVFPDNFDIALRPCGRNSFITDFAQYSDVVIFTGTYHNADELHRILESPLFIYNGAGINPIVVGEGADMDLAVSKILQARLFNSGQDCAGPDCILADETLAEDLIERLKMRLDHVGVGDYSEDRNLVGKLIKPKNMIMSGELFGSNANRIVYGGQIEKDSQIVRPTIIKAPLSEVKNYEEFFSPVIWISPFSSKAELESYFQDDKYKDFAMYVSVFGNPGMDHGYPNSVTLQDKVVTDIDRGNFAYGGYGPKSAFVRHDGKQYSRPILISREISRWQNGR